MNWFESWESLGATALAGGLAYGALVTFLRLSGKRTLAKLNAFDLVVTVALGSTLASVLTSDRLPLANGLLALALLVALQYAVAWVGVRVKAFAHLVRSTPALLLYQGEFLDRALRRERVTREEVLAAVRSAGAADPREVLAVVLETDGSLSVVGGSGRGGPAPSLTDVRAPEPAAGGRGRS